MGGFAVVALGFAYGLWFVQTSPYRHAALWQEWAPLLVVLTTTAGAAFPHGLDRWAELGQLLNEHPVRVRHVVSRIAAVVSVPTIRIAGQPIDKLAAPTPDQQRAFDLIGAPIPLTLTTK